MGNGIKNITNSFTLNLKNNQGTIQPLNLFQLGASGSGVPIGQGSGFNTSTFLGIQTTPSATQPSTNDYFNVATPLPDDLLDAVSIKETCVWDWYFSDGSNGSITLPANYTLNQVQAVWNTSSIFSTKGVIMSITAVLNADLTLSLISYNFTYETSTTIDRLEFSDTTRGLTTINFVDDEETNGEATSNNVWVSTPNNYATSQPTYSEINQSQNGSVYDIISMSIETKVVNGADNQVPQLLQPISFSNVDVDGNEQQKAVVSTIDPNQFQDTLADIQLDDENNGVNYQLDGETALQLNLEGLANFNLTLNYVQLPNLVAGTEFGVQQAMEEQAQMQQEAKDNNYKRKIKLSKKSIKALKKDVKKKSPYHLLQDLPSFQTMCGYSLEYSLLPMY
tara:strand:- start:19604 stop:20782 length:1179 start_codon:yes stop_codon:yes gene_type:complete